MQKNYRVTAFMYIYHKYILRTPFEKIDFIDILSFGVQIQKMAKLNENRLEELLQAKNKFFFGFL